MQVNRNDPCPCGSGKKHKKCCGNTSATAPAPEVARANAFKALDEQLVPPLLRFGRVRLGPDWLQNALAEYTGSNETIEDIEMQLAVPWALFHFPADSDCSVARLYADEHGRKLAPELRALLAAQLQSWIGIWEVQRVEQGVGMAVKDLLTGEERFVHEISGSRTVGARDALLGRVVDKDGVSFFGGIHPQPLPPGDADIAVREVRRACRVRTRPVRVDQLREVGLQLLAIDLWRDLAVDLRKPRPLPTLTNTDGDPLVMTTDHFDIVTPGTATVIARLATFVGAGEPEDDDENGETSITITKPGNATMKSWDNTVIGRIAIAGSRLRIESNSVRRADGLRLALASHLGELVCHRIRDETDPKEMLARAQRSSQGGKIDRPREKPPEFKAIERELKERHMTEWVDEAIPALNGLTPREASRSPLGRKDLDLLLRQLENHESRLPADERYDVGRLRAVLGV
jgi:hypothetical protein